jgi:sugar lactone lactonase YvrE
MAEPARSLTARPAGEDRYVLGEGPRWDPDRDRLLWVDIERGLVLEGVLDSEEVRCTRRHELPGTAGAVAFATDGSLLVAAHDRLVHLDSQGRSATAALLPPGRRFNDGAVDPAGRFLVGTLALDGGAHGQQLFRLERDGSVTVLDDDLTLSNGLAWSADGSWFYSVDTGRGQVFKREYDGATGDVGERLPWLSIDDGYPDGIAVDEADHVWVAVWGAGEVRRFSPEGRLEEVVSVPAPNTSAVAFAGSRRDKLVITTARSGLTESELKVAPASGQLFMTAVAVPGLPSSAWQRCPLPSSPDPTTPGAPS